MRNVRVLVTGAGGFVGRALVQRLAGDLACQVVASTRSPVIFEDAKIELFMSGPINSQTQWAGALEGVDVVVHLAARAHVLRELSADPSAEFRRVNVEGTLQLAAQAARAGVKRFVFISTIGVNGAETDVYPFTEEDAPKPHSLYAQSKYEAELGLRALAVQTGLEVVIIRPPLVYGSRAPGNFDSLILLLARGVPLPLGVVTHNRRSLVALDNLVDLIVTCLDHPAAANQTFLVSDGEDISTADLLRRLGSAMGRPARLLPVPVGVLALGATLLGKLEMFQSLCGSLQVDMSKTLELLGWIPPVGVDEGLKRAVGGQRC